MTKMKVLDRVFKIFTTNLEDTNGKKSTFWHSMALSRTKSLKHKYNIIIYLHHSIMRISQCWSTQVTSAISTSLEYKFCNETCRVATLSRSKWAVKWRLTGRRVFSIGKMERCTAYMISLYWGFLIKRRICNKKWWMKGTKWNKNNKILMQLPVCEYISVRLRETR